MKLSKTVKRNCDYDAINSKSDKRHCSYWMGCQEVWLSLTLDSLPVFYSMRYLLFFFFRHPWQKPDILMGVYFSLPHFFRKSYTVWFNKVVLATVDSLFLQRSQTYWVGSTGQISTDSHMWNLPNPKGVLKDVSTHVYFKQHHVSGTAGRHVD